MGPAETPNTPAPTPAERAGGGGKPSARGEGRDESGEQGEVRNPIGDSGLADAPIGVSLNMRAHKELNSQDSFSGVTRALSEASP